MRTSPDPFCASVMSFIVMQNQESAPHTSDKALYEFYILIKISLSLVPLLCLFACLFVSLSHTLHTLSHTLFTPLDVILPDYYSRGQSGIRTDPWHWHWLIGFLRCLLAFLCVYVCLRVYICVCFCILTTVWVFLSKGQEEATPDRLLYFLPFLKKSLCNQW